MTTSPPKESDVTDIPNNQKDESVRVIPPKESSTPNNKKEERETPKATIAPSSFIQNIELTTTKEIQNKSREILRLSNIATPRTLVPITFTWDREAKEVFLVGDWNRWTEAIPLVYVPDKKVHGIKIYLPPGRFQFKYIVDLQSKYHTSLPYIKDSKGNANNIVDVKGNFLEFHISQKCSKDLMGKKISATARVHYRSKKSPSYWMHELQTRSSS